MTSTGSPDAANPHIKSQQAKDSGTLKKQSGASADPLIIDGELLTITTLMKAVINKTSIELKNSPTLLARIQRAEHAVNEAVARGEQLYGITTLFGGMANQKVTREHAAALQLHLLRAHDAGFGPYFSDADVRASMIVRLNSLSRGYSGVSLALLERYRACLNADFIPCVRQHGSIGASGDLTPLATIAGAVTGVSPHTPVRLQGKTLPAADALKTIGLAPLTLSPKAGLALINGTAMMTGVAARVLHEADSLFSLSLMAHALMIQALAGNIEAFEAFLHQQKPHPGQIWIAQHMMAMLQDSKSVAQNTAHFSKTQPDDLLQDRYSIRCLPQFLGPLVENFQQLHQQLNTEMNATTDNPLVDGDTGRFYHGGHFLGQYLAMGMDQLRQAIALSAKHLDAQIALLMAPEFSRGLAPSLVGDRQAGLNIGLKALQIGGNSIAPLLEHLGAPLADRFPTHAEQFNQNINSQGMGACHLAQHALTLYRHQLAIALIISVQACDLRAFEMQGHYRGDAILSPRTQALYQAVRQIVQGKRLHPAHPDHPLVWSDLNQSFSEWISLLTQDLLNPSGRIRSTIEDNLSTLL